MFCVFAPFGDDKGRDLLSAGSRWSPAVKYDWTSSTPLGKMRGCFSEGSSVQVF